MGNCHARYFIVALHASENIYFSAVRQDQNSYRGRWKYDCANPVSLYILAKPCFRQMYEEPYMTIHVYDGGIQKQMRIWLQYSTPYVSFQRCFTLLFNFGRMCWYSHRNDNLSNTIPN